MSLLVWKPQPWNFTTYDPRRRALFISDRPYGVRVYLVIALDRGSDFPFHRDDCSWVLSFQLDRNDDSTYHENIFQFLHDQEVQVADFTEEGFLWAEKLILSPMDLLSLSLGRL